MKRPLNSGPRIPDRLDEQTNFPPGWEYLVPDRWDRACKHDSVVVERVIAACTECGLTAFRGRRTRAKHHPDARKANSLN
jgi:hypothetical protein